MASGSSRTALGILGFHCGITEVVVPDLSWSYEQCFPQVYAVALTESLELDVDAMIEKLEELRRSGSCLAGRAAPWQSIILTMQRDRIFEAEAIRKLITYCLQNSVYVIDDLAYQNMAPVDGLPEIKTARARSHQNWCGWVIWRTTS